MRKILFLAAVMLSAFSFKANANDFYWPQRAGCQERCQNEAGQCRASCALSTDTDEVAQCDERCDDNNNSCLENCE